jgi:cell wall assembly regulator SMI1
MTPPKLDDRLLGEFREKLSAVRGLSDWTTPGLSDAEIDAALQPLGLTLPEEARVLWRWHDGVPRELELRNPLGATRNLLLPTAHAVREANECLEVRAVNLRELGTDSDPRYDPQWLPFFGADRGWMVDCSVGRDAPTPLRALSWEDPEAPPVRAQSLGEAVVVWMTALDSGGWEWDRDAGWVRHPERMPPELRDSALV